MNQNSFDNITLEALLQDFSKDKYNDMLDSLATEHSLASGNFHYSNDLLYAVNKETIKDLPTFKYFANCNLDSYISQSRILIVFTCLLAGSKVASIQEPVPSSVYTGKASQTSSFAENPGVLADRQNEWLKQATLYMGISNPTRMKGATIKV